MANKRSSLRLYSSYNFIDKDPVIDRVRTLVRREGLSYKEIHEKSDVAETTLRGWFDGKTRRPQYATVMAVVHALGYRAVFVERSRVKAANEAAREEANA